MFEQPYIVLNHGFILKTGPFQIPAQIKGLGENNKYLLTKIKG